MTQNNLQAKYTDFLENEFDCARFEFDMAQASNKSRRAWRWLALCSDIADELERVDSLTAHEFADYFGYELHVRCNRFAAVFAWGEVPAVVTVDEPVQLPLF